MVKFGNSLYADMIESQSERAAEYTQFNDKTILMQHLLQQLDETETFILENSDKLSVKQMCDHLGVNVNRYNYLRRKLIQKIQGIQQDIGL